MLRPRLIANAASLLVLLAASGTGIAAQERRAIIVGAPFGNLIVGLLLPISERFALRPDLSFGVTDRSYSGGGGEISQSTTVGLSALLYLEGHADERDYLVPRLVGRQTIDYDGYRLDQLELSAAYGRQGRITERLGIYGETGVAFTYGEARYSGDLSEAIRNWSAMARIGVIIRL